MAALLGLAFRCLLAVLFLFWPWILGPEWLQRAIEWTGNAVSRALTCVLALCLVPFALIALGALVTVPGAWAVFLALGAGAIAKR